MTRNPRSLSRREQQMETRTALVASASRLFAHHGFDGTSVQAIAMDAGFTRGAFYAHFSDKHEVLDAVISAHDASDRQRLAEMIGNTSIPRSKVADWIAESQSAEFPLAALRLEMIRHSFRSPEFAELLRGSQRNEVEGIHSILERSGDSLPLRKILSTQLAARLISVFLDGIAIHALVDTELDVIELWDALLGMLVDDNE